MERYILCSVKQSKINIYEKYGVSANDDTETWFFIDTMRGIDGIEKGLIELKKECEYLHSRKESYAIFIPKIVRMKG